MINNSHNINGVLNIFNYEKSYFVFYFVKILDDMKYFYKYCNKNEIEFDDLSDTSGNE